MTKIVGEELSSNSGDKITMPRTEQERPQVERQRFDFGGTEQKLQVRNTDPGYHYHWVNDYPGRIQQALAGGYEFVLSKEVELYPGVIPTNADLGEKVSAVVGGSGEKPLLAYLMRIPLEIYEEKHARLQGQIDARERSIKQGKAQGDDGSFYVPQGGISMKRGK